jgi:beta-glucosidase
MDQKDKAGTEDFRNASLPLEKRVDDLLSRLTTEEKVPLLAGSEAFRLEGVQRLNVPALRLTDGPTGVRSNAGKEATVFPVAVALAATFNPDLVGRVAAAIAREAHALGEVTILAPTINIVRTPVWGRNFETYSEDPYLAGRLGIGYVAGLQGEGIGASLKHYAANNQELDRMSVSAELDERTLREIYLHAFEMVVAATNPWTVMASYNKLNGTYASENRYLLTDILKKEWGYDGVVVSDWGAVHSTVPAANAGLDLEMPGPPKWFGKKLLDAVEKGEVSKAQLDDNARRMVRFILRTGALDGTPRPKGELLSDNHRAIAREAAEESIVLLKNDRDLLPFDASKVKTVALIGPSVDNLRLQGDGSSRVYTARQVKVRETFASRLGNEVRFTHADGVDNEPFPRLAQYPMFSTTQARDTEGLVSEYFAGADFSGSPLRTSVEKRFFRYMGENVPPGTPMGYRWKGFFWPRRSGLHEFSILGRGHARIAVAGKTVVDDNSTPIPDRHDLVGRESIRRTGGIALEAGRAVPIEIEFAWTTKPATLAYMNLGVREPVGTIAQAVEAAKAADAAIVMVGSASVTEAEGYDRENIDLPGAQDALVEAILAANPNTVVVVNAGSPMALPWIDKAKAVLVTWLPGEEGPHALANVLFGFSAPSGRLPVTFPKRFEDNPAYSTYRGGATAPYSEGLFVGYRHYDKEKIAPLFAFGHGLSYTTFAYSTLAAPTRAKAGDKIEVKVTVANTGRRSGKESVQLYVAPKAPSLPRPPKELKAFAKVSLNPGESKTVSLPLDARSFSFYDPKAKRWVAEAGDYDLLIAASAADIRLSHTIRLE